MNTNSFFKAHYLTIRDNDYKWGIVCTTTGMQIIGRHSTYPIGTHPSTHQSVKSGRILNEYQLVYITKGEGYFESNSCERTKVKAGDVLFLFPGEWHRYKPADETGWTEYWVGFKGVNIDRRVEHNFFKPVEPILHIGYSSEIENLYLEIIRETENERTEFQILVSSIVLHILGEVLFKKHNKLFENNPNVEKINIARNLMKENISNLIPLEKIAEQLNVSYTWFRQAFKQYTGFSPAQYQLQLKLNRAKELLINSNLNISEISYELGFDNASHFCTFFKSREKMTANEYRLRHRF